MRVLAVINWDPAEKPTTWAAQRLEGLRRAGVEGELLAEECVSRRRGYWRLWKALRRRLRRERFDLVVPLYGSLLGLLCAAQRRVPCVVSFAGSDLNGTPERRSLEALCVPASQLSSVLARAVSVHTPRMRQRLWWPPARRSAAVLFDGTDVARFVPRSPAEARRRRGLPERGARVLFVATRVGDRPGKRLGLARAAVARLEGVELEVVSDVPFAEMPFVYASADVLVLTSFAEGAPNCVKEALACAIPVVAVDVGDVREVLDGLTNCAVVPPDAEALARALAAAIADGRGCPDGPARIAARYSLDAAGRRFADFFAAALGGAPGRPATSPAPHPAAAGPGRACRPGSRPPCAGADPPAAGAAPR
jgi:glycosyltransferase involved in cell wall biosynthesis